MEKLLLWLGRASGIAGALVCIVAIAARLTDTYLVISFQAGTLLLAGVAAMLMGCLCLLNVLTLRH